MILDYLRREQEQKQGNDASALSNTTQGAQEKGDGSKSKKEFQEDQKLEYALLRTERSNQGAESEADKEEQYDRFDSMSTKNQEETSFSSPRKRLRSPSEPRPLSQREKERSGTEARNVSASQDGENDYRAPELEPKKKRHSLHAALSSIQFDGSTKPQAAIEEEENKRNSKKFLGGLSGTFFSPLVS